MRSGFCRITATKPTLDSQVSNVATWCLRKLQNTKMKLHEIQVKLHEIWLKKQVSTAFSIDLEYNYHNRILFRHFQWLQPVKFSNSEPPIFQWLQDTVMKTLNIVLAHGASRHFSQNQKRRPLPSGFAANEKSANEITKCRLKMLENEVVQYSKQLRNAISFHGCLGFQSALGMWYILIYIYTSILWSHHQLAILKPIRATGWIENWRIELTKKKLQKWVSSSIDLYIC